MNRAQRREAARRGQRFTPRAVAYDVVIRALDRHEWNTDPLREELDEIPCDGDCYALVAETIPVNSRLTDNGVVVVSHIGTLDARPACAATHELLPHVEALMDEKLGRDHWKPASVVIHNSVPEWQVDPDEPPCTREEGLRRIEAGVRG
jgi:hypothetical protein